MGFPEVFAYAAGKQDWFAAGLPREGRRAAEPRVGDVARRDVPTCRLTEQVGVVRQRLQAAGATECVVVDDNRVVLGLLRDDALDTAAAETTVEEVMDPGPSTFRPDLTLEEMAAYLHQRNLERALITTADGVLVGIAYHADLARR